MIKLVVIGAGDHSRLNHLSALQRYNLEHPGEVVLSALCDLRREHVESIGRQYGFERTYTNIDEMLARESPDGCIAITPVPITRKITVRLLAEGIPLLIEKPPGANLAEAEAINERVKQTGIPVMVSMNRRFAPVITHAQSAVAGRHIERIRATMLRTRRVEPEFFYGTGMHSLDAMRHLGGDIGDYTARYSEVEGIRWYSVEMDFIDGASGQLEVMPTCGCVSEKYELLGDGFRVQANFMGDDSGTVNMWEDGDFDTKVLRTKETQEFEENGAYDETVEFIASIRDKRQPYPTPERVLQSVEICEQIIKDAGVGPLYQQ
jgi:predicted dehydrogenase